MTLLGYKNHYENVELFSENQHISPKKLNIRNFLNILHTKYPNLDEHLNIHVFGGQMMEVSFKVEFEYGFDELIHKGVAVVYLIPEYFVYNDKGGVEELYEIATYKNGKPNYSHYFTKDEIDTIDKFCDHLIVCADALITELPF